MKLGWLIGIGSAVFAHAAFLLFGGLIVGTKEDANAKLQEVDLLSEEVEDAKKDEKEPDEPQSEETAEMDAEEEPPPDAAEIVRNMEVSAVADAPALEAASLGAIEAALNGQSGGGDFADVLTFASGGRIGGTGSASALDETMEQAFSLAEIDQKPRAILQTEPIYPAEARGKKLEGTVTLIFVVDATGKVIAPKVEKSTYASFDKPALDALKQWKFEPAVKGGERVSCKMRVPIRFKP